MNTFKSTTVYIAMGESTQVYRSPEEIPADLQKQLIQSTRGMNSATILIADRGGREEIRKILNGQPSALKSRLRSEYLKKALGKASPEAVPQDAGSYRVAWKDWGWRHWAELLLPGAVGIALWVLFTVR